MIRPCIASAFAVLIALSSSAHAQICTADQLAMSVDQIGASLRTITADSTPKVEAKLRELKAKRGWSGADGDELAMDAIADARGSKLDQAVNEGLARVDQLGNLASGAAPDCTRLQDLDAAGIELQAAVKARTTHTLARLDALLTEGSTPPAPAAPPPPVVVAPKAVPAPKAAPAPDKKDVAVAPTPTPPPPAAPAPWSTTTSVDATPQAPPPPSARPDDDGFTRDDVVRASSGFFGQVSASLATVVEHAFSRTGRPTAYILGNEGGGAFIAGLRYGRGTLYLKSGETFPVYWHGPSVGFDVGAAGAKVMFLVYRLRDPAQLLDPFAAIDGSAFVAGGIGITLMSNSQVQVAPIRSGIGLRLGASVGYVRFTRRPTWNPF